MRKRQVLHCPGEPNTFTAAHERGVRRLFFRGEDGLRERGGVVTSDIRSVTCKRCRAMLVTEIMHQRRYHPSKALHVVRDWRQHGETMQNQNDVVACLTPYDENQRLTTAEAGLHRLWVTL